MAFNIPIALTWLRIALIPVLVLVFYLPTLWGPPLACFVFVLAAVTDWLDGYLARRLNQTSRFGAFLDPVADKLIVVVALILIVQHDARELTAIAAAIIIGREITISALREWMADLGERQAVAVSGLAKIKTIMQMTAIGFLLYRNDALFFPVRGVGVYDTCLILLTAAAFLTLWSMGLYLLAAWKQLRTAT